MLKINLILAILLLVAACNKDNSVNNPGNNTQPANNKAAALQLFEHFNTHNWQAMAACYADTALFLDPSFGITPVKQTRQQTIAKYNSLQQTIPDIHDSITTVFAAGDYAVVEFISTGTLPGGGKLKLPICTVLTFKNGLIVKDATYYDN